MVTTSLQRNINLCLLTNTTNIGQMVLYTIDCLIQEHDGSKSSYPYCCTLSQSISSDTTSNRGHCKKSTIKVIFDKSNTSSKDLKGSPTSDLQASLTTVKGVSSRGIDTSSKLQYSASSSSSSDENSIFTGR